MNWDKGAYIESLTYQRDDLQRQLEIAECRVAHLEGRERMLQNIASGAVEDVVALATVILEQPSDEADMLAERMLVKWQDEEPAEKSRDYEAEAEGDRVDHLIDDVKLARAGA
ncbi:MAG: hypothetical protein FWD61_09465 [Phycisphaerales bacterium]|nr:hypothetical protein [Phycisphaerales bacterium]